MNLFKTRIADGRIADGALAAPLSRWSPATLADLAGREVTLGVRAEDLHLDPAAAGPGAGRVGGRVFAVEPLGAETLLAVEVAPGIECTARLPRDTRARVDESVEFAFPAGAAYLFDAATGLAIPADAPGAGVAGSRR